MCMVVGYNEEAVASFQPHKYSGHALQCISICLNQLTAQCIARTYTSLLSIYITVTNINTASLLSLASRFPS